MTLQKFILGIDFTENLGDVNISRPEKVQINDTENIFLQKNTKKGDTRQRNVSSMYRVSELHLQEVRMNVT